MIKTVPAYFTVLLRDRYTMLCVCLNYLTIESIPGPVCFNLKFSSAKGPPPYILQTPVPSPCQ